MFSSLNEAWKHDPVKDMTDKLTKCTIQKCSKQMEDEQSEIYRFTNGDESIHLSDSTDYFNRETSHSREKLISQQENSINLMSDKPKKKKADLSFLKSDHLTEDTECALNIDHLKNCSHCYSKIKKLIDEKANKKNSFLSDSWKETLIIVLGAIIALFLIVMIIKSIGS